MKNKDKIKVDGNIVQHESAGGFVFCRDSKNHILLAVLKKSDGNYYLPKGHLKIGESPEEAALREVVEELTLKEVPKLLAKIAEDNYTFELPGDERSHFKKFHIFAFWFDKPVDIAPRTEEDFIEAKWYSITEARTKLSFGAEFLDKALGQLRKVPSSLPRHTDV